MRTLKWDDGSIADPTDVYNVSIKPHKVVAKAWVRTPADTPDPNTWTPCNVISATITAAWHGNPWRLEMETDAPVVFRRALVENGDGTTTEELRQWNDGPDVNPWGQWIRIEQHISGPGPQTLIVPWGIYRVEQVTTTRNLLRIVGSDALSALADNNDLRWSDLRLTAGSALKSRVESFGISAFPIDAWAPIYSWSGTTPGNVTQTTTYPTQDALKTTVAMVGKVSRTVIADIDHGRSVYRSIAQPSGNEAHVRDVRAGVDLISWDAIENRTRIINRVDVAWQQKIGVAGKQTVHDMRTRVAVQTGDLQILGRFGLQSATQQATENADNTAAITTGKTYLQRALEEATTHRIQTSPLYGVDIGDVIVMHDSHGNAGRGMIREMTVTLTQATRWSIKTVPTNKFTGKWWGASKPTIVKSAWSWATVKSTTVDDTCRTTRGWSAKTGCTLKDTEAANITITATANTGTWGTLSGWATNTAQLMRATIAVTPPKTDQIRLRVGINGIFGPWKECPAGKRTSVSTGEIRLPAKNQLYPITIAFADATPGSTITLGELVVEVPRA